MPRDGFYQAADAINGFLSGQKSFDGLSENERASQIPDWMKTKLTKGMGEDK